MAETPEPEPPKSIYDVPMDLPGEKPPKKFPPVKKFLKPLLILLIFVALGFIGWKVFGSKDPAPQTANENTQQTANTEAAESSTLEDYENTLLSLNLKHPDNWTVKESEGGVRLTSPDFKYQTLDGTEVDGNFRVYIRQGSRSVDAKYIGRGVAIKPSEKLSYNDPLPGQLKSTFLTPFGLDKEDNFAFFLIAGNFNLKKGETLGPNFGKEVDAYIISGGYSSDKLKDDLATNMMPVDIYDKSEAYKQAVEIVKSLQLR